MQKASHLGRRSDSSLTGAGGKEVRMDAATVCRFGGGVIREFL